MSARQMSSAPSLACLQLAPRAATRMQALTIEVCLRRSGSRGCCEKIKRRPTGVGAGAAGAAVCDAPPAVAIGDEDALDEHLLRYVRQRHDRPRRHKVV